VKGEGVAEGGGGRRPGRLNQTQIRIFPPTHKAQEAGKKTIFRDYQQGKAGGSNGGGVGGGAPTSSKKGAQKGNKFV